MGSVTALPNQLRFWLDIFWRMLRPRTVLLMLTFEAIGYEVAQPNQSVSLNFVLIAIMISGLYVCATCFNDAADEEVDKVNLPNDRSRPLVTTQVTAAQLQRLGVIALCISLLAAALVNPLYMLLVLIGAILNIFYSVQPVRMSYRGILASLWLSLSYVVVPFVGGVFITNSGFTRQTSLVLLSVYSCFVSRILLKDFRDYAGDKRFGKLNYLVRRGPQLTCLVSSTAWLIGDSIMSMTLFHLSPALIYMTQVFTAVICYELFVLAHEPKYDLQLAHVAIIGRMGNAVALALLTCLTLQAFRYSNVENTIIILGVGGITAFTAVSVSPLRFRLMPSEQS